MRHCQRPLTNRHLRHNRIHQVRRGFIHPPTDARRAKASALAIERHRVAVRTLSAANANKAVAKDATAQEGFKLRANKRGKVCIWIRQREICLPRSPVPLNATVKQRRLWLPPLVLLPNIPRVSGNSVGT